MENILEKEPVKRVQEFINQFDPKLKVLVLDTTARTAKDAAESLGSEVGAIVKSLVFRTDDTFLIPQAIKKKGTTKLINPIEANQSQSFENASIFIFFKKQIIKSGIVPKNTLNNAIVTGPQEQVAILILKKADDHIKANNVNKKKSKAFGSLIL